MYQSFVDFMSGRVSQIQAAVIKSVLIKSPMFFMCLDYFNASFSEKDLFTKCAYSLGLSIASSLFDFFVLLIRNLKNVAFFQFIYLTVTLASTMTTLALSFLMCNALLAFAIGVIVSLLAVQIAHQFQSKVFKR